MAAKALLTEADFDLLARAEGNKYELSAGEVVVTASARLFHNLIRDELGASLRAYCQDHRLGIVVWETEFRLGTATVRIPDLAYLRADQISGLNLHERATCAPDLAVEVVSPSNQAADLAVKVQQYLKAGSRQVWVLYPDARQVYLYAPGKTVEIREDGQKLEAPDLLPGWSVGLTELFNAGRPRR
ncbi:MAG TPA: Uma2 family endonuclease [Terriglobales bacterium]|jgi:Uma2 family endonuclease